MNKKIFYIFLGFFTSIFILLFIISNNINTKYKTVTINNVSIKGDTTRYKLNLIYMKKRINTIVLSVMFMRMVNRFKNNF